MISRVVLTLLSASTVGAEIDVVDIREEFHVRHWTTTDGLPNALVRCLQQTPDGYVWIGTGDGLARFDGRAFALFDRGNTAALNPFHDVSNMVVDRCGRLWAGVRGRVVCLDSFEFSVARSSMEQLDGMDGELMLVRGDVQIRSGDRRWAWYQTPTNDLVFTPKEFAGTGLLMGQTETSGLWVDELGRLTISNHLAGTHHEFRLPTWKLPLNQAVSYAATPEPDSQWWILRGHAAHERSTTLYELQGDRLTPRLTGLSPNGGRLFLIRDRTGALWFGQEGAAGLARYAHGRFERFRLPTPDPTDAAWCLLEGADGGFWVGTDKSGLYRLDRKSVSSVTAAAGLPDANVRALLTDMVGDLWAGTDQGLARLSTPTNRHPSVVAIALTNLSVRALAFATNGAGWAGTSRGLFRLSHSMANPWPLPMLANPEDPNSVASQKIRALAAVQSGTLWIGAPVALSVLPPTEPLPRLVGIMGGSFPLCTLLSDRQDNLWFATEGKGVGRLSAAAIRRFLSQPSNATTNKVWGGTFGPDFPAFAITNLDWVAVTNGLCSDHAWDLLEDSRGAIWVATDKGLCRLETRRLWREASTTNSTDQPPPSTFTFRKVHGLPSHQLTALIEDDFGHLWCGSGIGIFRIGLDDLEAVVSGRATRVEPLLLTEPDGLPSNEISGRYSHPCSCKLPDGRLAFATEKGIALLDPRHFESRSTARPIVVIEEVRADGEIVFGDVAVLTQARTDGSALATNFLVMPPVASGAQPTPADGSPGLKRGTRVWKTAASMPPGRGRVLEFRVRSPDFGAPEASRFRYRVDGFDPDGAWTDAGTSHLAYYQNLPPGKYRFRAHVRDHRLIESAVAAEFAFTLNPFFWQTTWFSVASVVLFALILLIAIRWRLAALRRRAALETENALLNERAGIARDLHDDLGPRLTQLALLTERTTLSEDGPAARSDLASLARELRATLDGTLGAIEPQGDDLASFADHLVDFAHDFLRPAGMRLVPRLATDLPSWPLSREWKRHVFLITKEALNNSIRHSAARILTLRVFVMNDSFIVELADDGCGFDPTIPPSGHQDGLKNMRSRAESVGARIEVRSQHGQGTTVVLKVPRSRDQEGG